MLGLLLGLAGTAAANTANCGPGSAELIGGPCQSNGHGCHYDTHNGQRPGRLSGGCYYPGSGYNDCSCSYWPENQPPTARPTPAPTGAPAPTVPAPTQSPATQVDLCAGDHDLINLTSLASENGGKRFCNRYANNEASCIVAFFQQVNAADRQRDPHARCSYDTSTGS